MDMNVVMFFAKMIVFWAVGGVLFVSLVNLLIYYLGKPERISYKMGVLCGVVGGILFACFQYFHPFSPLGVLILCGAIVWVKILYYKFIKKS